MEDFELDITCFNRIQGSATKTIDECRRTRHQTGGHTDLWVETILLDLLLDALELGKGRSRRVQRHLLAGLVRVGIFTILLERTARKGLYEPGGKGL